MKTNFAALCAFSLMLFIALLIPACCLGEDSPAVYVAGTVNAEGARLRSEPSLASPEIVKMSLGTVLELTELVTGAEEDWYRARLVYRGKAYEGFVLCRYVQAEGSVTNAQGEILLPAFSIRVSAEALNRGDNRVGHNWLTEIYVNGEPLLGTRVLALRPGDAVAVSAVITEQDARPDIGTAEIRAALTEDMLLSGFDLSLDVDVTENAGRYSGRTCRWTVAFHFRPVA